MKYLMYQKPGGGQITICAEGDEMEMYAISSGKKCIGRIESESLTANELLCGFKFEAERRCIHLERLYGDIVCAIGRADGDKSLIKEQRQRSVEAAKFYRRRLYGNDKSRNIDGTEELKK